MSLRLHIENGSEMPIYRQISEQIAALIKNGGLKQGEHLPPERELALQLKIARGTVKKAYEALVQQKFIVAARGRGSRVAPAAVEPSVNSSVAAVTPKSAVADIDLRIADAAGRQVPGGTVRRQDPVLFAATGRQEQASCILADAIIALEELGFSYRQINDLFGVMLARRQEQVAQFAIAVVDCNPEALGIYQKQLAMLTHMTTARFMLADLRGTVAAATILAPFDLILTTTTHVEELQRLAPALAHKVVPVIVSPTQATLIALARLDYQSRVGVLHQSARFFSIIVGWLQKSGFQGEINAFNTQLESAEELESFVANKSVLVVPPGFAAQLPGGYLTAINRFRLNGGQLIDFEYQIERGSLLHLEELIKSLLNKTRK